MLIRLRPSSIDRFPAARKTFGVFALCATVVVPMELLGTATAGAAGPSTTVVIPSNGSTVSSDIWLDASVQSPNGVATIKFEVSGGSVSDKVVSSASPTNCCGWLGAWDTTDVPNGNYTIHNVVTDNAGNSATSPDVSVTVDNLPLHTRMLVPSAGATVGGNVVLDASAKGTAPVTGVTFTATQGSTVDIVGTATPTIYGWIAQWASGASAGSPPLPSYGSGTWSLQSVATEVGGTTATSPAIEITLVTLADLQSSSTFAGNQYPGLAGCLLKASYFATYPGSATVGTITLSVNPCPSSTFTITTGVGTLSGTVGIGSANPIPPDGLDAIYALNIVTGTGLFTGTTGVLFFHSDAPGTAPFTGTLSLSL
jgi:hypothetical protein